MIVLVKGADGMIEEPQRYRTQYKCQQSPADGLSKMWKGFIIRNGRTFVLHHAVSEHELQKKDGGLKLERT